ncbi:MAG: ADP-ribosylglycohydrolase family protein [Chloracidobacterium sp.]|nr:ADP-ribosylglycohydrolase family protein [Chloracidobacterium sp.]
MKKPSVDECVQGFERILDKINPQQMTMLRAHYYSGGHAVTMRELATAAGYDDYKVANLQYGSLAKRLYKAIGYPAPKSPRSGKEYWILGLGEFIDRRELGLEMHCVMRLEIAGALERLRIVEPRGILDDGVPDKSDDMTMVEDETEVSSRAAEPTTQKAKTSETHPILPPEGMEDSKIEKYEPHRIRVDFLRSREIPLLNRLGITFAPGTSLLKESEFDRLQIGDLAEEGDINLIRLQVPADASVPESMSDLISMAAKFEEALRHGEVVIVHCKDKPEFAGLTAACIAIAATDAEISASGAIKLVRDARPGAVESPEHEEFVAEFEKEWREVMAERGDHYLLYWQERSVQEHASNDLPLDVIASNQLVNVVPGDTIWIVTLTQERGLVLAGRLGVGEVVEYEEAIRRMPDAGLWQAEYYAFPESGTEEYLREIDIHHLAADLRFDGEDDRLRLIDGKINPQQLQSIRKLTRPSAGMLEEAFYTVGPFEVDELEPEAMLNVTRQMVEMTPDDPTTQYNFGVALGRNEMYEDEIRAYERTLHLDPSYFGAQYNLGNGLIRLGRYEEAVEALNKAILISGEFAPAYFMLGVAYFESGRFNDAVAATRQGLEIDDDDESAYYNIAYWTFLQGDYRGALAVCDDVIARFPFYTSPHVLKGMCFRELGELDNEIQSYKDAVNIKVDDEGAFLINFTAVFFLGAAWERKMTGSDAGIEYIEADNHLDLEDPSHQFCCAMGHLAQGERGYADGWVEGLRTSTPDLARRLEAALEYAEIVISETHPIPVDMLGEAQPEEWPQQADLASDDRPVELEGTKSVRKGQPRKQIQINVDGTEITAKHNPDLYFQVLRLLVERGALVNLDLPISSGRKRNFLSRTPVHKDGSNFLAPVEFGGYYMESHSSRENGIKMLRAFLESLGIGSFVVADEDSGNVSVVEFQIPSFRERVLGSLLGLAVCDALGTTAEFKPAGTFPEITTMIGGGPFGLKPGEWTDDTSMALCLAESLIETGGFNATDQMDRYLRWKNEGYLSSNGVAFDIGTTIRAALEKYQRQTGESDPFCGSVSPAAAGNGSLMRLAPVPLFFASDPREAIRLSAESSRTTHGARECIDGCRYFAGVIIGALQGKTKDEIMSASFSPVSGLWEAEPLSERIADIANGAFKGRKPPQISNIGQGYVVVSLHAALWAFYHTNSFREGALKVVNLGYDSDTYGAIYGQLAGAYYGRAAIPSEWLAQLSKLDVIEHLANTLIRTN